jgi:adenosine deaminase/aminodeoxyfutalosine deaminase
MFAELHIHLEGALFPATLREIDPGLSREEIQAATSYSDFAGFLQAFAWGVRKLTHPSHYAIATRRLLEHLADQQVTHAEVILSAGVMWWKGEDIQANVVAAQEEAAKSPVTVKWNLDAVRQWGPLAAWPVVEAAAALREWGVTSFGLGGDESRGPATWFRDHFAYARDHGLRLTCHAGEVSGPQSVWEALDIGAERIGHGIRAVEDAALVAHLAQRQIPLEVSISSNVRTGAVASWEAHPVRRLFEAGVPITLNTDDPALFGTTLADEYAVAARQFAFRPEELEQIRQNAFRFRF